jgi:ribosomal protein L7/L12
MVMVQVFDCERRPRTISAIKYIRELRGVGLGEAKGLIDEVYYHARPVTFEFARDSDARLFIEKMEAFGFSCRCLTADPDRI